MKHLLIFFFVSLCYYITQAQQIEKPQYLLIDSTIYQKVDTNVIIQIIIKEEVDSYNVILRRFAPMSNKEVEAILKDFFKPEPRKI